MNCPKCGNKMIVGALGPSAKGSLFWANEEFFDNKVANLFTEQIAIKNGGIHIPVRNGITDARTKAWACEDCKLVLVDCN